jgi:hypothetical protein
VDTVVVVEDVAGIVVWVVDGTEVVAAEVAGAVVWAGDIVWVVFAAPDGGITMAAQTRNTRNTIVIVPGELLNRGLSKMFHRILLVIYYIFQFKNSYIRTNH